MKNVFVIVLVALMMTACEKESILVSDDSSDNSVATTNSSFTDEDATLRSKKQTFKVSIEAIDEGSFSTPFAPGVWIVQKKNSAPLFEAGSPDFGDGLEALAEDGSPGMLYDELMNHPKVREHAIFNTPAGASSPAPIFPGDAYEFSFTAKPNDYLNFATMFIQSNDLFIGPDEEGIALFDDQGDPISGDVTAYLSIWDAGTEVNEEPGVGPNQAPRQSGPDTGADENGVVRVVDDGYDYPAVEDIIRVTITLL